MKVEIIKIEDVENNGVLTIRCIHTYDGVHTEEFIRPHYGALQMKWLLLPDCVDSRYRASCRR